MIIRRVTTTLLLLGVIFCVEAAKADIIRNPLSELEDDICKKPKIDATKKAEPPVVEFPIKGINDLQSVRRSHIMSKLFTRYPVKIDYAQLDAIDGRSISDLIAEAVIGCRMEINLKGGEKDKSKAGDKDNLCSARKTATLRKTDSKRITDEEGLRLRRALLRLFEAADTGSGSSFAVIRHPEYSLSRSEPFTSYIPLEDVSRDDQVLYDFITKDGPRSKGPAIQSVPPYLVLCAPRTADEEPETSHSEQFRTTLFENFPPRENAPTRGPGLRNLGLIIAKANKEKVISKTEGQPINSKFTRKLSLVKTASDFAKSSPDAAQLTLVEGGSDGDNIKLDATFGMRWQKLYGELGDEKFKQPIKKISFTPYVSVQQAPTDFKFETIDESNGELKEESRKIAYADYGIGARFDVEHFGDIIDKDASKRAYGATLNGFRTPSWRYGILTEILADNYGIQHGFRAQGDLSFPRMASFALPGYRLREELLLSDKSGRRSSVLTSGMSLRWDFKPAIEYLDYTSKGAPPDFSDAKPDARVDRERFDTFLFGYDLEADLTKANLFGGVLEDSWITLGLRYGYRTGYDPTEKFINGMCELSDPPTEAEVECDDDDASNAEISLTLKHPDYSDLSLGLAYKFGEDTKNLVKEDSLGLTLGAKY